MIELNIPGMGAFRLDQLVCDVNGTLAVDGKLLDGVAERLANLQDRLTVHLLTADTHGRQNEIDQALNLSAVRLQAGGEAEQKAAYVNRLGAERVIAIGQGANDALMLRSAALGICILSQEGTAVVTLQSADLLTANIFSAFDLIENPNRIVATLRR
jgi:P-type E1-E2 ATPase